MKIKYEKHIDLALITAIIINEDILGGTVFQTFDLAYTFAEEFQEKFGYDYDWENHEITFDEAIIEFVKSKLK
tara:strand:- start:3032 stop:3250 length:219 start_codon:yes stop_codon:yes gene_type:complete